LEAETEVAGYGDAAFAGHGYAGAAVDVEGGGLGGVSGGFWRVCGLWCGRIAGWGSEVGAYHFDGWM